MTNIQLWLTLSGLLIFSIGTPLAILLLVSRQTCGGTEQ